MVNNKGIYKAAVINLDIANGEFVIIVKMTKNNISITFLDFEKRKYKRHIIGIGCITLLIINEVPWVIDNLSVSTVSLNNMPKMLKLLIYSTIKKAAKDNTSNFIL